jgi:hypothetical protein
MGVIGLVDLMGYGEEFLRLMKLVFGGELMREMLGRRGDKVVLSIFGDDVWIFILAVGGGKTLLKLFN